LVRRFRRTAALRWPPGATHGSLVDMSAKRPEPQDDPEAPDVPGFRTWRGVYLFVFCAFVAMVVLLTVFSEVFG